MVLGRGDEVPSHNLGFLVYCAGYTADYAVNPQATLETHALDWVKILQDKVYDGCMYLSSTRLYDSGTGEGQEDLPLILDSREDRHLFDISKAMGEWFTLHEALCRSHVLRLASVYADDLGSPSFLHMAVDRALRGQGGAMDSSPDVSRDYVHVEDVCQIVLAVAKSGTQPIYNVASGRNVDNQTLMELLQARTGVEFTLNDDLAGHESPKIAIDLVKDEFNIDPYSLADGLDRVLTYQDNIRAMKSIPDNWRQVV